MNIAAIILAAGRSRRFGDADKRLMLIDEEPLLRRVVRRVADSAVESVNVVTASGPDENPIVAQVLGDLPVCQIPNHKSADGMGTSIAAGIATLDDNIDGALIIPADMPEISPELINQLIAQFQDCEGESIIVPVDPEGRQRNPVLWPRSWFADLKQLDGEVGGKALIKAHPEVVKTVTCPDVKVFHDIDTRKEFAAYLTSSLNSKS